MKVSSSWALVGQEARAFAQLAALLPRDRKPVLPEGVLKGDDVVVLVHGLFATAGVMRPLRARLEQIPNTHTASFTYAPGLGVQMVAELLRGVVRRLPLGVRIHLVGHSLGGLVVRWFVQQTSGDARVVQTVSVAAPFGGARGARLMPGRAGRDIRPGSPVLRRLHESVEATREMPHLSIFGDADTAIPTTRLAVGEHCVIEGAGHNGLLFHPEVAEKIAERIVGQRIVAA